MIRYAIPAIVFWLLTLGTTGYGADDAVVRVVSSTDRDVVLELTVSGFDAGPVVHDGVTYQRVSIPSFGLTTEAGRPQVPVRGEMIAAPDGARPALTIVDAESTVIGQYDVAPVPHIEVDEQDGRLTRQRLTFSSDPAESSPEGPYPSSPVRLGMTGAVRGQAVAQVLFYPILVDSARHEIRFFTRLLVRVTFEGPVLHKAGEHDPVLKGLLLNDPPGGAR